jgi:hypothetical protein
MQIFRKASSIERKKLPERRKAIPEAKVVFSWKDQSFLAIRNERF